jgi:hypothetical protein
MPFAAHFPYPGPCETSRLLPPIRRPQPETISLDDLLREGFKTSGSAFWTIKYGLTHAEQELDGLGNLAQNWDSYGAEPPSREAIQASRTVLAELAGALILPSTIVPSASGGVSIYFMSGDRTAYIESYNDGNQALVMYGEHEPPEVLELGTEIQPHDLGHRITTYLDRL